MPLSKQVEQFTNEVVEMDEDMVVYLTGCPRGMAKRVSFRAWMMVVSAVCAKGEVVLDNYDTADAVIEAYGRDYMPEFFAKRDEVRAAMAEDGLAPLRAAGEADRRGEGMAGRVPPAELAGKRATAGAA